MTLLDVRDLCVRAPDGRSLVSGLSFSMERGDRLGLIGESGAGKTLAALAVIGLLPRGMSASGSVLLDGEQVLGAPGRRLDRLRGRSAAVVFQEPLTALDPLKRVGALVAEPLRRRRRLRGRALRSAVLDALSEVRLPGPERLARAFPYELSGGQRQRVAIAMALACEPALLIADEPTAALDTTVQAEMLALLDGLVRSSGMGLLLIGHDLGVVAGVADGLLVLHEGRAVERGTAAEIVHAPAHPRTREVVAAARRLHGALDGLAR
ncbi:ATP-binding cassette domain-containing protein [Nonomuraea phyllanthi]|uniref:ATP-binding cassette domain-containing protein n=1 Tax=Nonomuraea phyllanthi TaxID=2219224 RepID=UPI001293BBFF|nr:ABC transporter ATP-binding protein [Nonomuraea phyllanthi]QFY07517.1 ATP-binding cassette domain-containing protein [Nonomuraea phyllanthi]